MKPIQFDTNELKRVIELLKRKNIEYYIFGGYAIDAFLNETSNHEDLDMIVPKEQRKNIIENLREIGYKHESIGRILILKKETKENIYQIGVIFMNKLKHFNKIRGNRSEETISKEAFKEKNKVSSDGIEITIMPYEWFSLYKNVQHETKPEKNERHKKAMKSIIPLCKPLKILNYKRIARLKSDPKFKNN